jgi:hypothetical protein
MTHLSSLLVCSVVAATLVTSALGQTQTASEQTESAGSTVGTVVVGESPNDDATN